MRVLWLCHRDVLGQRAGGAERTAFEVSKRLVQRGHEVIMVSVGRGKDLASAVQSGVRLRRFPSNFAAHLAAPLLLHGKHRADVVIDDLAHVVPWLSPLLGRVPCVAFFRHLHRRTLHLQVNPVAARLLIATERAYPLFYRSASIVTESTDSVTDLIRLGFNPKQITVIHPGVDLELFHPGPRNSNPTIVYFAGMRPYKRPELLLSTLPWLANRFPGLECVMVGDGPILPRLRSIVVTKKLQGMVRFTGRVDDAELAGIVAKAWVSVTTSSAEGWGLTAVEAAASGVPTVAFDVPGLRDSIRPGVSGLLVQEGDGLALRAALEEVLSKSSEWSEQCRAFSRQFDWDRAVIDWERHLSSTVAGTKKRLTN